MTCLLRCMSPDLGHKTDLPGRARRGRNCPAVRTSETDRHPLQVLFGSTATFVAARPYVRWLGRSSVRTKGTCPDPERLLSGTNGPSSDACKRPSIAREDVRPSHLSDGAVQLFGSSRFYIFRRYDDFERNQLPHSSRRGILGPSGALAVGHCENKIPPRRSPRDRSWQELSLSRLDGPR